MDPITAIVFILVTAVVVAVGTALLTRILSPPDGQHSQQEDEISVLRDAKAELERRLAVEEEKASHIPKLETEVADLRNAKAVAEREAATKKEAALFAETLIEDLRQRLRNAEAGKTEAVAAYDAIQKEAEALRNREARLQESLELEKHHTQEKLNLLQDAKEQISKEFKLLAEDVLKSHGDTFTRQNRQQIEGLLDPLREKITEFQQGLQTAHTETTRERATLAEQIRNLTNESAKMTSETYNLTQALRSKGQTQGIWGEMVLSTILERAGLRKGGGIRNSGELHSGEWWTVTSGCSGQSSWRATYRGGF
jgi:DNA recombination protein RmuC